MTENADEILKRGYDYAIYCQRSLVPFSSNIEKQSELLCHFLFPNLDVSERMFLARLRLVQAAYSMFVNEFVYDKEGREKQTAHATHDFEQELMDLKNSPLLAIIKTKLSEAQAAVVTKHFETVEFLPPRK